jgi:hypothetical protein
MKTSYSVQKRFVLLILPLLPLLLAACSTLEVGALQTATPGVEVFVTEEVNLATRAAASGTPMHGAAGPKPTPTSVLDGGYLSFNDPALGLALDIPLWWDTDTTPGALTRFYQQDHTGARRNILTLSVLRPESNTLESALEEVQQGVWGPHLLEVQPIQLGVFEALRLDLSSRADQPPVVWLAVAPSGRAVVFTPGGDPAWIEPMIGVVLGTLRPVDVVPLEATPASAPTFVAPTPPQEAEAETPYCRPSEAAVNLSASTTTLKVGQSVTITVTLSNGDTSDVRLGNVQYSLGVQPPNSLTSDGLTPVVHAVSLEPGQSDEAAFVLQAERAGRATLRGATSFEIHAMDYSWGSWSGCDSWPFEVVVAP